METRYSLDSRISRSSDCNAAARLIFMLHKFDHVTPFLLEQHWLCFPDRIDCNLAVMVFKCLDGRTPSYLASEFHRVADVERRQRLRSASTADLLIPRVSCAIIGGRAFPVAG